MPTDQEPTQADTKQEPEVKYVLSGQPTGWWAAAKDIREFDVEKVQSCKEDIDTLLVFAGLFSAVLSAFVVAVYPNLQQAPSDRIVYAIERVAAQTASYRVNLTDGTLIATNIPSPSPPPFQVSDDDIRVNVLWFASLIISLVTASFGMLVKQWLREFLATEDPSALHRLRLRHFREPQMKVWMVYEIAGILPILLHVSLGLFFVGLCYFTSSVHSSIGHTTIPLVVGWALCFFASIALPIFFPRCPYKMASLKVVIAQPHRIIRRLGKRVESWIQAREDAREMEWRLRWARGAISLPPSDRIHRNKIKSFISHLRSRMTHLSARVPSLKLIIFGFSHKVSSAMTRAWAQLCSTTKAVRRLGGSAQEFWRNHREYLEKSCKAFAAATQTIPDEATLVEESTFDLDILSSVDAIQGNDEMLGTIIPEALHYTHPRPRSSDVIHLVVQLLEHRVPTVEPSRRKVEYWPFDNMTPLDRLRPQARDHILSILFGHIKNLEVEYTACRRYSLSPGWKYCFSDDGLSPGGICREHIAVFCAFFLASSLPGNLLQPSALAFLRKCFGEADLLRWLCYDRTTTNNNESLNHDRASTVISAINDLTNTGQLQLSFDHRVKYSTMILDPCFHDLVYGHDDDACLDTWKWPESHDDLQLRTRFMAFWLDTASEELNKLDSRPSTDLLLLVFSLRQFYAWLIEPATYISFRLDERRKVINNCFRKIAHIAVKREDTALMFVDALLGNLQSDLDFEALWSLDAVMINFEHVIQPPWQDPAIMRAVFQRVTSKIKEHQDQGVSVKLELCRMLAFFFIVLFVERDLREECREMFSHLATIFGAGLETTTNNALEYHIKFCFAMMKSEDRAYGALHCPRSEEDSIFPDALLDALLKLGGEGCRDDLPRELKTRPASEPDLDSAAVTSRDSASTSGQAVDVSNLSSTSGGEEAQPTHTAGDVGEIEVPHEVGGNDV